MHRGLGRTSLGSCDQNRQQDLGLRQSFRVSDSLLPWPRDRLDTGQFLLIGVDHARTTNLFPQSCEVQGDLAHDEVDVLWVLPKI